MSAHLNYHLIMHCSTISFEDFSENVKILFVLIQYLYYIDTKLKKRDEEHVEDKP